MSRKALCVGINDYPGSSGDLNGCVNDANDWKELLEENFNYGGAVKLLSNKQATRQNIMNEFMNLLEQAGNSDHVVFTFSGHGTNLPDQDHDDGDNYDEAIVAYDDLILDDEFRALLKHLAEGARLTAIIDSCYSGGIFKAIFHRNEEDPFEDGTNSNLPSPRFLPSHIVKEMFDTGITQRIPATVDPGLFVRSHRHFMMPDSTSPHVLITGCNALELSWDAYINGRYNGAMTYHAIRLMEKNQNATYRQLHKKLRQILPYGQYLQSPQLEGREDMKNIQLFS